MGIKNIIGRILYFWLCLSLLTLLVSCATSEKGFRTPARTDEYFSKEGVRPLHLALADHYAKRWVGRAEDIEVHSIETAGWQKRYQQGPPQSGEKFKPLGGMPWNEIWVINEGSRIRYSNPDQFKNDTQANEKARMLRKQLELAKSQSGFAAIVVGEGGYLWISPTSKEEGKIYETFKANQRAFDGSQNIDSYSPNSIRVVAYLDTPMIGCVMQKKQVDGREIETCTYQTDEKTEKVIEDPSPGGYQWTYENAAPGQVRFYLVGRSKIIKGTDGVAEPRVPRFKEKTIEEFKNGLEARSRAKFLNAQIARAKAQKVQMILTRQKDGDGKDRIWIEPLTENVAAEYKKAGRLDQNLKKIKSQKP